MSLQRHSHRKPGLKFIIIRNDVTTKDSQMQKPHTKIIRGVLPGLRGDSRFDLEGSCLIQYLDPHLSPKVQFENQVVIRHQEVLLPESTSTGFHPCQTSLRNHKGKRFVQSGCRSRPLCQPVRLSRPLGLRPREWNPKWFRTPRLTHNQKGPRPVPENWSKGKKYEGIWSGRRGIPGPGVSTERRTEDSEDFQKGVKRGRFFRYQEVESPRLKSFVDTSHRDSSFVGFTTSHHTRT